MNAACAESVPMLPPLRIMQVVPAYYPSVRYGGPIRSVHGLSAALARQGHEVHVVTTSVDGPLDLDVPLGRPVVIDGVHVWYFAVPALRRLCWSPSMWAHLRQRVRDFDVVHLHSCFLWPTWAAARTASAAGVPYVLSPRGMLVGEMIRRKSRWVKQAWIELAERRTLREAAAVHVTADVESRELQVLRFSLPEVVCIPNGVDIPVTYPSLAEGPFQGIRAPYALFLGRISWKKGLDRLISAWKWVPDLTLIVAGNDEETYLPALRAQATAEGVADRIQFVGAVADTHKWALYRNAEFFVLPSYSENFGNAVAEAMAMSCPVIVSADVGIASLVAELRAGEVADCSPRALAATMCRLHADPLLRSELGARARRGVADRLSWDAVATAAELLYRRLSAPNARSVTLGTAFGRGP